MYDPFRRPILYLVRHGSTANNANNEYRGWDNPPLDMDGHASGGEISNYFQYERIGRIISSDLTRAVETADYVLGSGAAANTYVEYNSNLRPWNIGDFAGKDKATYGPKLQKYIDTPSLVVPNGESLDAFRARSNENIMAYMSSPYNGFPNAVIVHTSNICAFQCAVDPSYDGKEESQDMVEPGGIVAVYMDAEGCICTEPRLGAVEPGEAAS